MQTHLFLFQPYSFFFLLRLIIHSSHFILNRFFILISFLFLVISVDLLLLLLLFLSSSCNRFVYHLSIELHPRELMTCLVFDSSLPVYVCVIYYLVKSLVDYPSSILHFNNIHRFVLRGVFLHRRLFNKLLFFHLLLTPFVVLTIHVTLFIVVFLTIKIIILLASDP